MADTPELLSDEELETRIGGLRDCGLDVTAKELEGHITALDAENKSLRPIVEAACKHYEALKASDYERTKATAITMHKRIKAYQERG